MTALQSGGMRDFFVCDFFEASPKADLGSLEHPMFLLSTRPDRTIRHYHHKGTEITVTPSVRGRATIHDKDILIYCVSQLMAAINAGRTVSRKLTLTAYGLLLATRRDTGGDSYMRLREGLERRVYELARKHCGQQREWRVTVATLHAKAGSDAPLRVFRAAVRRMIADNNLPDYALKEEMGDVICFGRKRLIDDEPGLPTFAPETLDRARDVAPGFDVYALRPNGASSG